MLTETFFQTMQVPALYTPSPNPFWDDDHISKGMLAAHLSPDTDAASRKPAFLDSSAAWIADLLPPGAYPLLLDLGCGPGLYAQRFARAGYRVTGVDISRRSLDYARCKAEEAGQEIRYVQKDYRTLALQQQFDAAVLIYCDYGALSSQDRHQVLRAAHSHLRPGGKLLLDVFTPAAYQAFATGQTWEACPAGGYWSDKPHVVLDRRCRYNENVTLHQIAVYAEEGVQVHYIWHTYFTREALQAEAEAAGFTLAQAYADVAGAPFREDSPTLAVLLQR